MELNSKPRMHCQTVDMSIDQGGLEEGSIMPVAVVELAVNERN
jgi:hypothetical protein